MPRLTGTTRTKAKALDAKRSARVGRRRAGRSWLGATARTFAWLAPLAGVAGTAGWFFVSGTADRVAADATERLLAWTADAGLRVGEVMLEGRAGTRREEVMFALGVQRGDPILAFDPYAAQKELEQIPWVSAAEVERRLPDLIYVRLLERRPLALWQSEGKMAVIDEDGIVLTDQDLGRFHGLPLVVGKGAAPHAQALIAGLADAPAIANRLAAAVWVGDRRWDLRLDNGVTIRLPEDGLSRAIARLVEAEARAPFLDKDIVAVDLRQGDRMVVQLTNSAAERIRPPPPPQRRS